MENPSNSNITLEYTPTPAGISQSGQSTKTIIGNNHSHGATSPGLNVTDHTIEGDEFQIPLSETEMKNAQNNIIIEMPEITTRLDKMESDIGMVVLTVSNIEKKINKLIEAIANMGTLMSTENSLQLTEPIGTTSSFSTLLPINDQHAFIEFETMLRNKTYYQKFVTEMTAYGGTSGDKKGDKIAYGLIDQLFTRQFMTQCSWTGSSKSQKTKISFSAASSFLNAFYEVINLADSRYGKTDAKEFFKDKILRNANSRLLNLQQTDNDEPTKKRRRTIKAPVTESVTNTTNVTSDPDTDSIITVSPVIEPLKI